MRRAKIIYRIHFEPEGAYWCIQFQRFLTFWTPVRSRAVEGGSQTTAGAVLTFDDLAAAESYVSTVGIDRAYHRAQTKNLISAVQANAVQGELPATEPAVVRSNRKAVEVVLSGPPFPKPVGPANEKFPKSYPFPAGSGG